jgi:hypothetical protein
VEVQAIAGTANSGFTGASANAITAALSDGTPVVTRIIGTMHFYAIQLSIPTNIPVPCSGTGTVAFVPTPGSSTAKSAIVNVSFISQP